MKSMHQLPFHAIGRSLIGFMVAAAVTGCSGARDDASNSAGATAPTGGDNPQWQTLTSACGFSLRAPTDFVEVPVQGIDSCVAQYDSAACSLFGDSGWYSDTLDWASGEDEYQEQSVSVDSQSATLVTFRTSQQQPYVAAIHVPDVDGDASGSKLTLSAQCEDAAHRDEMVTALETLAFD